MGKWHGKIGYVETKETAPGVWRPTVTERTYYGDVITHSYRWSPSSDSTNDDLQINTQISILADSFTRENWKSMKYIEFMGTVLKITNVTPQYPRLVLTLGGIYDGEQA